MSVRKTKSQSLQAAEKLNGSLNTTVNSDKSDMPLKLEPPIVFKDAGAILTLGTGDTGQLGLGPDITERTKPCPISYQRFKASGLSEEDIESFIQVCAGGMHTVCLSSNGSVYTFGCNDEGALGRMANLDPERENSSSDDDETIPGRVKFPEDVKIVMISAGDSHTGCLDSDGQVWAWGTFRGASGPIGLVKPGEILKTPFHLQIPTMKKHPKPEDVIKIIKISSGQDHIAMLSEEGNLYTMGCAEQGQLGRVAERFSKDGGRSGMDHLLTPTICRIKGHIKFCDVWAGGFATFAKSSSSNIIYACGLNNYGQLGLKTETSVIGSNKRRFVDDSENPPSKKVRVANGESESASAATTDAVRELEGDAEEKLILRQGPLIQFMLTEAKALSDKTWKQVAIGMHHVVALSDSEEVFSIGRTEYGRLGLGKDIMSTQSISQPKKVTFPPSETSSFRWVGVGESCSFAITKDSKRCYAWGLGSNMQLAQPSTDDNEDGSEDMNSPSLMVGKSMQNRDFYLIDGGGQHTVLIGKSCDEESKEKTLKKSEDTSNGKKDKKPDENRKGESEKKEEKGPDSSEENKDKDSDEKNMDTNDQKKSSSDPKDSHIFTEPVLSGKKAKNITNQGKKAGAKRVRSTVASKKNEKPVVEAANEVNSEGVSKTALINSEAHSDNLECLSTTTSIFNAGTIAENQSLPSPPGSILDDTSSLAGNASVTTTGNLILFEKSCAYNSTHNNSYCLPAPNATNYSTAATANSGSNSIDSSVLNWSGNNGPGGGGFPSSLQGENDIDFESSTSGSQVMGQFDEDTSCKCTDGGSSHRSSLGGASVRSSLVIGGMAGSGLGLFSNILLLQQPPNQPLPNNILGPPLRSSSHRRDASINRTRNHQRQHQRLRQQIQRNNRSNSGPRSCRQMARQFHSSQCHMSSVCSTKSESIGFPTTNTDSASFDSIDSQSL